MARGSNKGSKNSIPAPSWPESLPLKYEEKVLSIVCSRTHLHWAIHEGTEHGFVPVLFWRTPPLSADEKEDDPCTVLARHLPKQAHEVVFGSDDAAPTKTIANSVAASRRIPALTIYVISSCNDEDESLKFLFADVPYRMFKLSFSDFIDDPEVVKDDENGSDNIKNGITAERAAALAAASDIYKGIPVLIFDAGTCLSYTAMDAKGKLIGGGIGPGMNCRFRAFHDYSGGETPRISFEEYKNIIEVALENGKPLEIFSRDIKTQFMADTFCEVAGKCRSVVKHFLAEVKKQKEAVGTNGDADDMAIDGQPDLPVVIATGGDCGLIEKCLKPDHAQLVPAEPGTEIPSNEFILYLMKHLPHYGISCILKRHAAKAEKALESDEAFRIRSELIGNRVAKQFGVADYDGDFTYRGSIVSIKVGPEGPDDKPLEKDWFFVRFDDGDKEHLDIVGLYDALELYKKVGEKAQTVDAAKTVNTGRNAEESFQGKKQSSSEAADSILKQSVKVQEEQKRRAESKTRGIAAPSRQERPPGLITAQKRPYSEKGVSPSAKKAKKSSSPAPKKKVDGTKYINMRVAKEFEQEDDEGQMYNEIFYGTIDAFVGTPDSPLWHVKYDDDDEEDYDEKDIKKALKLYKSARGGDEKATAKGDQTTNTSEERAPGPFAYRDLVEINSEEDEADSKQPAKSEEDVKADSKMPAKLTTGSVLDTGAPPAASQPQGAPVAAPEELVSDPQPPAAASSD